MTKLAPHVIHNMECLVIQKDPADTDHNQEECQHGGQHSGKHQIDW